MPDVTFDRDDGRRLPCLDGKSRTEYHEAASGLRLRVTSKGARTWAVAYWSPVKKAARRLKLGDADTMPLGRARAAARAALHAVEAEGRDPMADRHETREREREARAQRAKARVEAAHRRRRTTFGKVLERYVEARRTEPGGKLKRPASRNTVINWRILLRRYILPAVGERRPDELAAEDLLAVLEDAVRRGGLSQGPRVRDLLSAAWRWMEARPRTLGVVLPAVSPLRDLPTVGKAERERERVLSPAEVWRFWRAAEAEGLPGEALRFSLLTASRVREATFLPWSEVDLEKATWRLPAARSKSGRAREVPLSPQAVELLRRVQRQGGDYAFGRGCHYRVYDAMKRLREATGGEPWQPRDLRRTGATLCARLGADPFVVALTLGHARPDQRMPAVTGGYLRWNYADQVRRALDRLGAWIEETVSQSTEPGDVVSIEVRR